MMSIKICSDCCSPCFSILISFLRPILTAHKCSTLCECSICENIMVCSLSGNLRLFFERGFTITVMLVSYTRTEGGIIVRAHGARAHRPSAQSDLDRPSSAELAYKNVCFEILIFSALLFARHCRLTKASFATST
jgi:hypothetical protein